MKQILIISLVVGLIISVVSYLINPPAAIMVLVIMFLGTIFKLNRFNRFN